MIQRLLGVTLAFPARNPEIHRLLLIHFTSFIIDFPHTSAKAKYIRNKRQTVFIVTGFILFVLAVGAAFTYIQMGDYISGMVIAGLF